MVARALPVIEIIPLKHRSQHRVALLLLEEQRATERFIDGYYRGRCNPRGFVALARNRKPLAYILYHLSAISDDTVIVDALTVDDEDLTTGSIIEIGKLLLDIVKGVLSAERPRLFFPTRCFASDTHAACAEADMALVGDRLNYFSDGDTACCYEYFLPYNPEYAPGRRFGQSCRRLIGY